MAHSTKKLGMMFTASAWVLAFLVMALAFSKILDSQNNPNQSVSTLQTGEFQEVVLTRNRSGHYVFDGEINRQQVTFLVDTGATTTAIPAKLQRKLGLEAGPATSVSTANGVTTAYLTRLDQLAIGDIELYDVNASIIAGMAVATLRAGAARKRADHSTVSLKLSSACSDTDFFLIF
ncbi:MAG: TIGR02281 family clan AA aspartic protease [Gammaproteobacteria bacterium]|nr:TIGR02281 family clan AA aspartic protease [Gammaproteobacteria bacterium]